MSLKWKLFFAIFLFTLFIIFVIVVFQISLLEPIYRRRKINGTLELTNTIHQIVENQKIESFYQNESSVVTDIQKISTEEAAAIYLFKEPIDENAKNEDELFKGTLIYKSASGGYFNKLDYENIQEIWQKGRDFDTFYAILGISPSPNFPKMDVYDAQLPKKEVLKKISNQKVSLMCCTFVNLDDNTQCLLIIDNNLVPLDSAVAILKLQLTYISIIVVVIASVVAILLARNISKPITKLNNAAKKMANGQYDVKFEGSGYLEINELNENLNNTVLELQKTENLRRELMANVSHDLKTPLTMIKGYAEMMKDLPSENTPENLEIICSEVERLNHLVNDMLDLSKLSSKTMQLYLEDYSITDNLTDIVERMQKLNIGKKIDIQLHANENIMVHADYSKMEQVMYNFIYNAINYSKEAVKIDIIQERKNDLVRIFVKDNGIGISEADLKVIWDRYYRVDKTHQRASHGSGLGLSIVKEILEYHAFDYGVESSLNEGSTFWFEMPIINQK